jgi:pimeloyl-ACP methyl ester carboxylesterase
MKGKGEVGGGPDGYIDDQLGDVRPWGFEPGRVTAPVLVFHGRQDRIVPSAHGARIMRGGGPGLAGGPRLRAAHRCRRRN